MVTSGSLGGVMVSDLGRNARDVHSISTLGKLFPIFIIPTTQVAAAMYNLHSVWLLNLLSVCICKAIACMYVIVSVKILTILGGQV